MGDAHVSVDVAMEAGKRGVLPRALVSQVIESDSVTCLYLGLL